MSIEALNQELDQLIFSGQALEAFEKFYADGVVMQHNSDEPWTGKDVNREREKQFFASVEGFHGGRVIDSAVSGDVSFSEQEYDVTFKGGTRVKWAQVARRQWKDGQIVHERFYYKG